MVLPTPLLPISADTVGMAIFYIMLVVSLLSVAAWAVVKIFEVMRRRRDDSDDDYSLPD